MRGGGSNVGIYGIEYVIMGLGATRVAAPAVV